MKQSPCSEDLDNYLLLNWSASAREMMIKQETKTDVKIDNDQSTYDNRILTYNLYSNWSRMAKTW